jgi:putative component of toxin-antitoxin plasmid stabilization module
MKIATAMIHKICGYRVLLPSDGRVLMLLCGGRRKIVGRQITIIGTGDRIAGCYRL